ncbi:MAG: hypothetical protein AAGM22_01325 [Acidobacteriota bacterium]
MEILVIGAIAAGFLVLQRHLGKKAWEELAAELGLEFSMTFGGEKSLHGSLRGFGVSIHGGSQNKNNTQKPMIVVRGVDPGFTLAREGAISRLVGRDISTGDPEFDSQLKILGDEVRARAVLGDEARRLAFFVISTKGGELQNSRLTVNFKGLPDVRSTLESMLQLAERLRWPQPNEIPVLLAERALNDDSFGVRLEAFRQLTTSFPRSDRTLFTAEQLLRAHSADLRLEASLVLLRTSSKHSERAAETLVELVKRRHVAAASRRAGLAALASSRHRETTIPLMADILRGADQDPSIRSAALEGLFQAKAHDELLKVRPVGAEECERLAQMLRRVGVAAEPQLLELLHHPEDSVRLATIKSLEHVGGRTALAPLHEVSESGTFFDGKVARAARGALETIQRRIGGPQGGEISIAAVSPLDGALSPTKASKGGEVSFAEDARSRTPESD